MLCFILVSPFFEAAWYRKQRATFIYRDAVRSSDSHFVKTSGFRWLSLKLLVKIPWAERVWVTAPALSDAIALVREHIWLGASFFPSSHGHESGPQGSGGRSAYE